LVQTAVRLAAGNGAQPITQGEILPDGLAATIFGHALVPVCTGRRAGGHWSGGQQVFLYLFKLRFGQ
jgi:hypothetical protein